MSKKVLILTTIVLVFSACEVQADVINSKWVGGEEGEWGQASNWDPAIVPDNSDLYTFDVIIDSNYARVDEIEVALCQSRTLDQLACMGEVEIGACTAPPTSQPHWIKLCLAGTNGLRNHGKLEIAGIELNGDVTNPNGAYLETGKTLIVGNLHNLAGATMCCLPEFDVNGRVQNAGLMIIFADVDLWPGAGFNNSGQIRLLSGICGTDDLFDNNNSGGIEGSGTIWSDDIIQNKGRICAFAGSLLLYSEGHVINTGTLANNASASLHIMPSEDVNNQGTIEVNAGGGVTFDCNLVNESASTIKLFGGTLAAQTITQSADATFKGQGDITGNLVIETEGLIQLTGPANIFGNVQIDPNATLEISDGTTLITGQTSCNGTIHMKGGRIIPQGGLFGDCNIIWEPGIYTNIADFNLDGLVNLQDFAVLADTWLWKTSWR